MSKRAERAGNYIIGNNRVIAEGAGEYRRRTARKLQRCGSRALDRGRVKGQFIVHGPIGTTNYYTRRFSIRMRIRLVDETNLPSRS